MPAGLQAEQGAPVVDQIEFHVAAAAVELEVPFSFTKRRILAFFHDGQVGIQVAVTHRLHECEASFEPPLIQVVEEQAADTPGFVAVFQEEVFITPLLVAGIDIRAKGFAGGLCRAVPVNSVFLEAVIRGEIIAAAEPPHRILAGFFRDEEAHVGMGGGHVGIAGMDDEGDAQGLEAAAGQFRTGGRGRAGQPAAMDMGEVHARLLENPAFLQYTGTPATAAIPFPAVLDEAFATISRAQLITDVFL